jgi:hypothetical protein
LGTGWRWWRRSAHSTFRKVFAGERWWRHRRRLARQHLFRLRRQTRSRNNMRRGRRQWPGYLHTGSFGSLPSRVRGLQQRLRPECETHHHMLAGMAPHVEHCSPGIARALRLQIHAGRRGLRSALQWHGILPRKGRLASKISFQADRRGWSIHVLRHTDRRRDLSIWLYRAVMALPGAAPYARFEHLRRQLHSS